MILILSINPLSMSNSNGRTMANMFSKFKKDELLNIYVSGTPDYKLANFINVKDKNALFSTIKEYGNDTKSRSKNTNKNIFKVIIRELIWKYSRINKKIIVKLKNYNITEVFIQLGDYSFLIKLAEYISKELNLRIVTFNTEDYYFKKWDYYQKKKCGLLFTIHQNRLKKNYRSIYLKSEKNIFLTNDLEELHKNEFNLSSTLVIYTSSTIKAQNHYNDSNIIAYCGNLSNGRDLVIKKVIECINSIDNSYIFKIYSPFYPESLSSLLNLRNVFFEGFLPYENVIEIVNHSFLNIAIDGFDDYSKADTLHAFSTKIADLLATGNRFLLISPENSTSYKYLDSNKACFLCNNLLDLPKCISKIINEKNRPYRYRDNAINLYEKNHNSAKNSEMLMDYINNHEYVDLCVLVTTINKTFYEMKEYINNSNIMSKAIVRSQNMLKNTDVKNNNIRYLYAKDIGTSINRNTLFSLANSDYVIFADDDIEFSESYIQQVSNAIRNNCYPDGIEFSFYNSSGVLIKKKNKRSKFLQNKGFTVNNFVLSKTSIKHFFGNKPFNELFGPGTDISCGEDSIFRKKVYSYFNNIYDSSYILNKNHKNPSTWYHGDTEKYFLDRSKVYGYLYPHTYYMHLLRMKCLYLRQKNCNLVQCLIAGKEGKRIRKNLSKL